MIFNNPDACYRAFRSRLQQNDDLDRLGSAIGTGIGIGRGQGIEFGIVQDREEVRKSQKIQRIINLHASIGASPAKIAQCCECEESYVLEVLAMFTRL